MQIMSGDEYTDLGRFNMPKKLPFFCGECGIEAPEASKNSGLCEGCYKVAIGESRGLCVACGSFAIEGKEFCSKEHFYKYHCQRLQGESHDAFQNERMMVSFPSIETI